MISRPPGVLPAFFSYYETPVKLVTDEAGHVIGWQLSRETGGWKRADNLVRKILLVGGDEIEELSRDEFIEYTEHDRGRYLRGAGPIFALYETVGAIVEQADLERRPLTPHESALVMGIRRKTFVMFEEQLQRAGDPAADPSLGAEEGNS
ncbi:hypothetical protein [Micromonospora peucetia]|uniref:Uncharacterized protein n=1 Tax=Micromonospora peucetia TaxID=47871 RepID=A0A1C6UE29_9ACTN|nr:hypothetical protein [Micromonospora peucetia]WSA33897.1 hypothetical protein OIE14_07580 [Micromonospora peucetia]SCL52191.1 hypothetical protein GA0070608_0977 [Micromonospora peucetia]